MIIVVDYDMGNLNSVSKALTKVGAKVEVCRDPEKIRQADKLVVPGVGAFGDCMKNLQNYGLLEPIREFIRSGKPYLGICLGMQILMSYSLEFGKYEGLGIFEGEAIPFDKSPQLKVPHMGWNQLKIAEDTRLFQGVPNEAYVYFVHSFYVEPKNPNIIAATTDYGVNFTSALEWENIFATQFHPEKSQNIGLKILQNFCELTL